MPVESPELIEERLAVQRQQLAAKVDLLQSRTTGAVREAVHSLTDLSDTVSHTMGLMGDTVQGFKSWGDTEAVMGLVQEKISEIPVTETIRQNPLTSVGGAVVAGFLAGFLLNRVGSASSTGTNIQGAMGGTQPSRPSIFDDLINKLVDRVGTEVSKAAQSGVAQARGLLEEKVNKLVG